MGCCTRHHRRRSMSEGGRGSSAALPAFFGLMSRNNNAKFLYIVRKSENGDGECIGQIPEEEAICDMCYSLVFLLQEDIDLLRTSCGCKSSLIHESCASESLKKEDGKCSVCEQLIQCIPVTLSRTSTHNPTSSKRSGSRFSKFFGSKKDKSSG